MKINVLLITVDFPVYTPPAPIQVAEENVGKKQNKKKNRKT